MTAYMIFCVLAFNNLMLGWCTCLMVVAWVAICFCLRGKDGGDSAVANAEVVVYPGARAFRLSSSVSRLRQVQVVLMSYYISYLMNAMVDWCWLRLGNVDEPVCHSWLMVFLWWCLCDEVYMEMFKWWCAHGKGFRIDDNNEGTRWAMRLPR